MTPPSAGASPSAGAPRVELLGKPGCHLCDDARPVVARVCEAAGVAWAERDISASAADTERWGELIPVVIVDGEEHARWRVDEARLRAALRPRRSLRARLRRG